MSFLKGLTKLIASPVRAVAEVARDVTGNNGDDSQFLSLATLGASSIVKGLAKAVKESSDEIFDE